MKVVNYIKAIICVVGLAACFDAIMNHVMTTSVVDEGWFDTTVRYLIVIGRITFGWFICGYIMFPIILRYFKGESK